MQPSIDVYFTSISPFTYLGHNKLGQIAQKHKAKVNLKPMPLMNVWKHSGAVPPAERPPARLAYRMIELQRARKMRDVSLNLTPKYFPTPPMLADKIVIAVQEQSNKAFEIAGAFLKACWGDEQNIADEACILSILKKFDLDGEAVLSKVKQGEFDKIYENNTQDAVQAQIIGAPAYIYKGEQFWGQDRLELLDEMLKSGREAYKA